MKPAACKRLFGGLGVFQIAFHSDVALEHDLAHGLAILRHRQQGGRVEHAHVSFQVVTHALPGVQAGALANVQRVPCIVLGADGGWAVDLGQAVNVGQVKAQRFHAFNHRRGRRCACHHAFDTARQALLERIRRVDQHAVHDGRSTVVGHAVGTDRRKNLGGSHLAQAHVHACTRRHRPRKAPAVAMKHGQRP